MATDNCPFDVTPYDASGPVKAPKLVNLNYTNQDFWSMKSRLVDFIKERFGEDFNDFVESDLAVLLIENWAFIADTLSFKIDQVANEIYIDTVSEVDNAFRLAMLVGFKPQPPMGARSLWSATISNALETDMVIPVPVSIPITTEAGPRRIELYPADAENQPIFDQSIIIPAGSFVTTAVVGLEGETYSQSSTGTGVPNQFTQLSRGPVIGGSIRVSVDGSEWTQVDHFTDSQPRREFRVEYDPAYNAFVVFGTSRSGLIPAVGADIRVSYRVGGGPVGNIVTGSVELQKNFLVPGFSFRMPVTFRNYTRGEFGHAGDTITDIKRKLPAWLRTQDRVVSGDDLEAYAGQFVTAFNGQVGKARATLRSYGCSANVVDLYVLAREGEDGLTPPDPGLKLRLSEDLEAKKMLTQQVCVKDGAVVEVDVTVDLTLDKFYRKFEEDLREKVLRRVSGFFSLANWDFGKTLKSVDLVKAMSDMPEVSNVDVHFQTAEEANGGEVVTARYYEVIRPSIVNVSLIYE